MHIRKLFKRWRRAEAGASGVEYAILLAGIAALLIATVSALGQTVTGLYTAFTLR